MLETAQSIIERTLNDVKVDDEKLMANLEFCSRSCMLCFCMIFQKYIDKDLSIILQQM